MSTCSRMMDFFSANFMLQAPPSDDNDHQPPSSLSSILPTCTTPQDFHGIAPMLGKRSMSFSGIDAFHQEANGGYGGEEDNLSDDGSQAGEIKKRRLNMEQVKTLERSFEMGNKLEPERKIQLAKALGLQPRQIAIWFQNRRARWKTKTLEKDYETLKRQFDALKADNDSLLAQNQQLQSELSTMRGREPTESINLNKDTDQGSSSNRSENSSDTKLDISTRAAMDDDLQDQPTTNRPFFQPRSLFSGPGSSRAELQGVKEESFTAMFTGIDDQPTFWPWIEQHNFN